MAGLFFCCIFVLKQKEMTRAHNFIDREGENHISNEGCKFIIIKYVSKRNCTVQFEDGHIKEGVKRFNLAKEIRIKEVADKWRGQITEPCYEAMYAYEVEITD